MVKGVADEFCAVGQGLYFWQIYDSKAKADLFSTAIESAAKLVFVDPIPLDSTALDALVRHRTVSAIVVTNSNHGRAAEQFAAKFAAPIFAHPATAEGYGFSEIRAIHYAAKITQDLHVIEIAGAPPGEIALHCEAENGTVIMGDALINFEPYGFTFLPAKYCTDSRQMLRSLRGLLEYKFERMLFAHGSPLLTQARARLEQILIKMT